MAIATKTAIKMGRCVCVCVVHDCSKFRVEL